MGSQAAAWCTSGCIAFALSASQPKPTERTLPARTHAISARPRPKHTGAPLISGTCTGSAPAKRASQGSRGEGRCANREEHCGSGMQVNILSRVARMTGATGPPLSSFNPPMTACTIFPRQVLLGLPAKARMMSCRKKTCSDRGARMRVWVRILSGAGAGGLPGRGSRITYRPRGPCRGEVTLGRCWLTMADDA